MIELFFACLYALFLLYLWNRESKKPIVDNSDPRVVHIIYPKGRRVSKDMMNPHIGESTCDCNLEQVVEGAQNNKPCFFGTILRKIEAVDDDERNGDDEEDDEGERDLPINLADLCDEDVLVLHCVRRVY